MTKIFVYIPFQETTIEDIAFEYFAAAQKIDKNAKLTAVVTGSGSNLEKTAKDMSSYYPEVIQIDNEALSYPNAEIVKKVLADIIPVDSIFLIPHNSFGMDLGPGLSIKMSSAYAADIIDFEGIDGKILKAVRQELGGAVNIHLNIDIASGAVISIRPGSFLSSQKKSKQGKIIDKSKDLKDLSSNRKFLEILKPEMGDVDITKSDVIVSIGRGIEDEENIELAQELAKSLNAVVACSRPIVDSKWLEKSRQVGTSGQTIKPKVYLAMGISGSFQHMGGIKGNPFIVAVNKNPKAPIFQAADIGIVEDILDFMPSLTDAINDL